LELERKDLQLGFPEKFPQQLFSAPSVLSVHDWDLTSDALPFSGSFGLLTLHQQSHQLIETRNCKFALR